MKYKETKIKKKVKKLEEIQKIFTLSPPKKAISKNFITNFSDLFTFDYWNFGGASFAFCDLETNRRREKTTHKKNDEIDSLCMKYDNNIHENLQH